MKKFHIAALACIAVATLFYLLAWLPGMVGFGVFGILSEIAGWVAIFKADK